MGTLMDMADLKPAAKHIVLHCADTLGGRRYYERWTCSTSTTRRPSSPTHERAPRSPSAARRASGRALPRPQAGQVRDAPGGRGQLTYRPAAGRLLGKTTRSCDRRGDLKVCTAVLHGACYTQPGPAMKTRRDHRRLICLRPTISRNSSRLGLSGAEREIVIARNGKPATSLDALGTEKGALIGIAKASSESRTTSTGSSNRRMFCAEQRRSEVLLDTHVALWTVIGDRRLVRRRAPSTAIGST